MSDGLLAGWTTSRFAAEGFEHEVYWRGQGPGVLVVHEIPGITPLVARFANDVVEAGFRVAMPNLFGTPGKQPTGLYTLRSFGHVCVSKEFTTFALRQTSPVVGWLRALGKQLHAECGGPGIGALGMCFSGGFALGLMLDATTIAPVLSQPSMPFPLGRERAADLNLSPADLAVVKARAEAGCDVFGLRFDHDKATGTRFETLSKLLGERFISVELPSTKRTDHSVLTEQRDEPSVQRVLEFFHQRLHV